MFDLQDSHTGIIGRNGSGKSQFAAALAESSPDSVLVSFETEDALLEREIREDDTDFLDRIDPGRSVLELIREVSLPEKPLDDLIAQLGLTALTDRGFRLLSTGERRRLMLARALVQLPKLLILDEPFDGLDRAFREQLRDLLKELSETVTLVIVANRISDLEGLVTHLTCIDSGICVLSGPREEVEKNETFRQILDLGKDAPHRAFHLGRAGREHEKGHRHPRWSRNHLLARLAGPARSELEDLRPQWLRKVHPR
ncbi:ATP-binding cassette domain-containing protein, partial [Akkermansiaceae bacterium]|nr:ATP-binding cassette domain-containing protein [Akkermansiaceae bacterium]